MTFNYELITITMFPVDKSLSIDFEECKHQLNSLMNKVEGDYNKIEFNLT